ncbi:MAG: phytanoyl-CoA dioxygenase [Rhodospirillales bacterium]|nr:phytanoyl-CoA dioxygenase [Rhodospirillales bacterium]
MPKTLTPDQIRQFEEDGYVGPLRMISTEAMAALRERIERFERDHPEARGKLFHGPQLLFPWLFDFLQAPALLDALEDLLGPDLLCIQSGFRIKEPQDGRYVGWHQDSYYIRMGPTWVVAVISFTDSTRENGAIQIVPGSHKWGLLPHEETDDKKSMLTRAQRITAQFDTARATDVEAKAGEALILANTIVHGSQPNRTDERRINYVVEYAPTVTKREGPREPAMLVRGVDRYNHFDREERPKDEFGPLSLARHRHVIETRIKESYRGSKRASPALG